MGEYDDKRREIALTLACQVAEKNTSMTKSHSDAYTKKILESAKVFESYMSDGDVDSVTINGNSNLVKHAETELRFIGEEPDMIKGYLEMISVFSRMGHSGGSASVFISRLIELLNFNNLTPLTDYPGEWMEVGDGMWQNTRNSAAFSDDGGKHFWLLSDGASSKCRHPLYESKPWEMFG